MDWPTANGFGQPVRRQSAVEPPPSAYRDAHQMARYPPPSRNVGGDAAAAPVTYRRRVITPDEQQAQQRYRQPSSRTRSPPRGGQSGRPATDRSASPRFIHEGKLFMHRGSVFEKLTDPTLYTGTHRHRFDERGRGRGFEGRDSHALPAQHSIDVSKPAEGHAYGDDRDGERWQRMLRGTFHSPALDQQYRKHDERRSKSVARNGSRSHAPYELQTAGDATSGRHPSQSPPRFEAWALDAHGNLVRDEVRTAEMNYGPYSDRQHQVLREQGWRDVPAHDLVGGASAGRSYDVGPLPSDPNAAPHEAYGTPASEFDPVQRAHGDEVALDWSLPSRTLQPWERDALTGATYGHRDHHAPPAAQPLMEAVAHHDPRQSDAGPPRRVGPHSPGDHMRHDARQWISDTPGRRAPTVDELLDAVEHQRRYAPPDAPQHAAGDSRWR